MPDFCTGEWSTCCSSRYSEAYPSWIPGIGGESFLFFSPIFNLADSYITIGVLYMLLFQRKFFK